jgi:hypothetical protein
MYIEGDLPRSAWFVSRCHRALRQPAMTRGGEMLRIRFILGSTYDYWDVPAKVFDDLLAAESKGRFVNWKIKPYFRYKEVD